MFFREPISALIFLPSKSHLQGLIDLDHVIIITGFAEVGPWGSPRTRWEMEARGEFRIEGCIEMGGLSTQRWIFVCWMVDSKTNKPEVAMAYRKISLHRQTVPLFGHWFAWQKL
jgi:hypothetical protein